MHTQRLKKFLTLAAALASLAVAAPTTSLTVWIPEQGQAATLSSRGLVGAAGNPIAFYPKQDGPLESPLDSGFARLTPATRAKPARLEVLRGGHIMASRIWPENPEPYALRGTQRGPCIAERDGQTHISKQHCFTPDLKPDPKAIWATVPLSAFVTKIGTASYTVLTDWDRKEPVSDEVKVIRRNLSTGQEVTLSYRVTPPDVSLAGSPDMTDPFDRRARAVIGAELPGERYLVCATTTIPKDSCRLDVVDRDFRPLFSLQGDAYTHIPQPTKDSHKLFYLGNTLQVWDAQTGKRLSNIHNPQWNWDKRRESPFIAYLTPDSQQAAIITATYPVTGLTPDHFTAYIYRLKDSKLLGSFVVKP